MLRRGLALSLTCLFSTLTIAAASSRGDWSVVQPPESSGELLLWSQPGRARVMLDDEARSYGLGADEELLEIARTGDGWIAAGRRLDEGGSRLLLVEEGTQGFRRLPVPRSSGAALQLRPRLLTRDGRLDALVWLEGDTPTRLTVRASSWSGADWAAARTVSGEGPGSQTGLSAATLRDGGGILVWSAYDGNDDEIMFSRSSGDGWSPPKRLTDGNRVPDVAPTVIATGRGALVAWSRFNGDDYDLVVSRLRRGRWSEPRVLARNGALFPQFVRTDEGTYLLYRSAKPRGWGVLEVGAGGGLERRAEFLETDSPRPSVELDGTAVNLRWPFRKAERGYWSVP